MRRLEPQAAVALPPIPSAEERPADGWVTTHRRPAPAGRSPRKAESEPGGSKASPREKRQRLQGDRDEESPVESLDNTKELHIPRGPRENGMKSRTIANWLNSTLTQALGSTQEGTAANAAKQMLGLVQFGIDPPALERLGLDTEAADLIYRAMFVYSQGLHSQLQEVIGRSKNSSAALLIVWKAFSAVLENAGQGEQMGTGGIGALVQRGNEEERIRIEAQWREQISSYQAQVTRLVAEKRTFLEEVQRIREDDLRLRNESEMYREEHRSAMVKYEHEIKLRMDAEVRCLDMTRWKEALEEELARQNQEVERLTVFSAQEVKLKEEANQEIERLQTHVKFMEQQSMALKQNISEASLLSSRKDQHLAQLKQQLDRNAGKIDDMRTQFETEVANGKRLAEQVTTLQKEIRKVERLYEDVNHSLREAHVEVELYKEKNDRLDKELTDVLEERRVLQKQLNDVTLENRTGKIELKSKTEELDRTERQLTKLTAVHRELMDTHRSLVVDVEHLREDVVHLDNQVKVESELRKQLQQEKRTLSGTMVTLQAQLETSQLAASNAQRDLDEVTVKKVRLEAVLAETKSSMQKLNLEKQIHVKAHAQKVSMLEKVITDERTERRHLVQETEEVSQHRSEALDLVRKKDADLRELRRLQLEKEEEADRLKVLLKAQEHVNAEQLVTLDKYHAVVAGHEAEMRQMQVLLECERQEAQRQLRESQDLFAAGRHSLEQRVEQWKFAYEDVLSRQNFNPASQKLLANEVELARMTGTVAELQQMVDAEADRSRSRDAEIRHKDGMIIELRERAAEAEQSLKRMIRKHDALMPERERSAMAREDAMSRVVVYVPRLQAAAKNKAVLEKKIEKLSAERDFLLGQAVSTIEMVEVGTQVVQNVHDVPSQTELTYQYAESFIRHAPPLIPKDPVAAAGFGRKNGTDFVNSKPEKYALSAHMHNFAGDPAAGGAILYLDPKSGSPSPAQSVVDPARKFGTSQQAFSEQGSIHEPWPITPPLATVSKAHSDGFRSRAAAKGALYVAKVKCTA